MQLVNSSKDLINYKIGLWSFKTCQHYGYKKSYKSLYDFLQNNNGKDCLCEHMQFCQKLRPYIDIEWNRDLYLDRNIVDIIDQIKQNIIILLGDISIQTYVREGSGNYKNKQEGTPGGIPQSYFRMSYHVLFNLTTKDNISIYMKDRHELKNFAKTISPQFYDENAYKGFNLRLSGQDKYDIKLQYYHDRVLVKHPLTDTNDDLFMFVGYCPNKKYLYIDNYVKKHFILKTVKELGYSKDYTLKDIKEDQDKPADLCLELTEQKCPEREHKSNNSLALFFTQDDPHLTIKCMDEDCQGSKTLWLDKDQFQINIKDETSVQQHRSSRQKDSQDSQDSQESLQLLSDGIQYQLLQNAHNMNEILTAERGKFEATGKPFTSRAIATMFGNKVRKFQGIDGKLYYELNGNNMEEQMEQALLDVLNNINGKYTKQDLKQLNIQNNTYNFITINNNAVSKKEKNDGDDDIEIKIKKLVENDLQIDSPEQKKYLEKLFLGRMNYITYLYDTIVPKDFIYKPNDKKERTIYYFTNVVDDQITQGGYWTNVDGIKQLKKRIRSVMENFFDNILLNQNTTKTNKKQIRGLLNKIQTLIDQQGKIEQFAMESFQDSALQFNKKTHLLHFVNGTFNIEDKSFIQTTPNMYNTQQIEYEYNRKAKYDFIEPVIQQIIGDNVYQWFLQQLSFCLMPEKVLEKKQIIILTGNGNNGKTLIFNLMNNTMSIQDEGYGCNCRSQLIQLSNDQLSAPSQDLMELKDKRFIYFSELDANKNFNQQQIKILTGGDIVKGRELYEKNQQFEAYGGLFVSCNQIPKIQTADGGFLNRLKIIELRKQFVDNPDPRNQYQQKKNSRILTQIKSKKWKQGFMNMLLDQFYKNDIEMPHEIQEYIDQKVNLNKDQVSKWAEEKIDFGQNAFATLEELIDEYNNNKEMKQRIGQESFKTKFEYFLRQNPSKFSTVVYKRVQIPKSLYNKYEVDKDVKQAKKYAYTNIIIIQ